MRRKAQQIRTLLLSGTEKGSGLRRLVWMVIQHPLKNGVTKGLVSNQKQYLLQRLIYFHIQTFDVDTAGHPLPKEGLLFGAGVAKGKRPIHTGENRL